MYQVFPKIISFIINLGVNHAKCKRGCKSIKYGTMLWKQDNLCCRNRWLLYFYGSWPWLPVTFSLTLYQPFLFCLSSIHPNSLARLLTVSVFPSMLAFLIMSYKFKLFLFDFKYESFTSSQFLYCLHAIFLTLNLFICR